MHNWALILKVSHGCITYKLQSFVLESVGCRSIDHHMGVLYLYNLTSSALIIIIGVCSYLLRSLYPWRSSLKMKRHNWTNTIRMISRECLKRPKRHTKRFKWIQTNSLIFRKSSTLMFKSKELGI